MTRAARTTRLRCLALVLAATLAPPAVADCERDRTGEVYCGAGACIRDSNGTVRCSRFDDGGAQTLRDGTVVCGRGQCARSTGGDVFCSSEPGGAVTRDSRGRVRCEGRCAPGSTESCESVRADAAG